MGDEMREREAMCDDYENKQKTRGCERKSAVGVRVQVEMQEDVQESTERRARR